MKDILTLNPFEAQLVDDVAGTRAWAWLHRFEALRGSAYWLNSAGPQGRAERDAALDAAAATVQAAWEAAHRMALVAFDSAQGAATLATAGARQAASPSARSEALPTPQRCLNDLSDVALSALSIGLDAEWEALQRFVRPRLALLSNFDVSAALVRFGRGEQSLAVRLLEEGVLRAEPFHEPGRCARAFMAQCRDEPGWQERYRALLATCLDPGLRRSLLALLDHGRALGLQDAA